MFCACSHCHTGHSKTVSLSQRKKGLGCIPCMRRATLRWETSIPRCQWIEASGAPQHSEAMLSFGSDCLPCKLADLARVHGTQQFHWRRFEYGGERSGRFTGLQNEDGSSKTECGACPHATPHPLRLAGSMLWRSRGMLSVLGCSMDALHV